MNELEPQNKCSICSIEDEDMHMQGYFGIIPVSFCETCFNCCFDMIEQIINETSEDDQ